MRARQLTSTLLCAALWGACNDSEPPPADIQFVEANCPSFQPGQGQLGSLVYIEGGGHAQLETFLQATNQLVSTSLMHVESLALACQAICVDLGTDADHVIESAPALRAAWWCTKAAEMLGKEGVDRGSIERSFISTPSRCSIYLEQHDRCIDQCAPLARCSLDGDSAAQACSGALAGTCLGMCKGACDGGDRGVATCAGRCTGLCVGQCDGAETGQGVGCDGRCEGSCRGVCASSAPAPCEGLCIGACSTELIAPRCDADVVAVDGCDAGDLCQQTCQIDALAAAHCQGGALIETMAPPSPFATTRGLRALREHVPDILRARARQPLLDSAAQTYVPLIGALAYDTDVVNSIATGGCLGAAWRAFLGTRGAVEGATTGLRAFERVLF